VTAKGVWRLGGSKRPLRGPSRPAPRLHRLQPCLCMRLFLLPLAALLACSNAGDTEGQLRTGTFQYTARSAGGQVLLVGQLTFTETADSTVTGTWNIRWAPGADTTSLVGPQVGSGILVGLWQGSALLFDLNPGNADHNVLLQAYPRPGGYAGTWDWTTFNGPRITGTFVATN